MIGNGQHRFTNGKVRLIKLVAFYCEVMRGLLQWMKAE